MELGKLVEVLKSLAPLELAASWDNVGLLLQPSQKNHVSLIVLTIDLTEKVLDEIIRVKRENGTEGTTMIMSYHPPIFQAMKRLTQADVKQRIVIRCIENQCAIYSPHSALDSVAGGINDWLAEGLGEGRSEVLQSLSFPKSSNYTHKVVVYVPEDSLDNMRSALAEIGVGVIGAYKQCAFYNPGVGSWFATDASNPVVGERNMLEKHSECRLEMNCGKRQLSELDAVIRSVHPFEEPAWDAYPLADIPSSITGSGRVRVLTEPIELRALVDRVKKLLNLKNVRLAISSKHTLQSTVQKVALCAGSGGSVIKSARADVYLTGEMSHHEVLDALAKGTSVILCEHTNTERGYLPVFKTMLEEKLQGKIDVHVSTTDADPLTVV